MDEFLDDVVAAALELAATRAKALNAGNWSAVLVRMNKAEDWLKTAIVTAYEDGSARD